MIKNRYEESDRIKKAIDDNWKIVNELHEDNKRLTNEYNEALEAELGSVLPTLQKLEWKLDILFDMGTLLADQNSDLELYAVIQHKENEQRILKMFAPSSRERIACKGVKVENSGGVLLLKVDLGTLVRNVEWCLENGINVVSGLNDEKVRDIFECQDKINAMYRLLKHEEGQKETS